METELILVYVLRAGAIIVFSICAVWIFRTLTKRKEYKCPHGYRGIHNESCAVGWWGFDGDMCHPDCAAHWNRKH